MKKTLIFLTLLLVTCKASAADHSYLVGEHSSKLFPLVGAPKEKMNNSLTGKSIWTYKDFKVLIRKDQVIQVLDLNKSNIPANQPKITKAIAISVEPHLAESPTKEADSNMLGEIMKELETKTTAGKPAAPGQAPNLLNPQANSLQNNMLKFKQ